MNTLAKRVAPYVLTAASLFVPEKALAEKPTVPITQQQIAERVDAALKAQNPYNEELQGKTITELVAMLDADKIIERKRGYGELERRARYDAYQTGDMPKWLLTSIHDRTLERCQLYRLREIIETVERQILSRQAMQKCVDR